MPVLYKTDFSRDNFSFLLNVIIIVLFVRLKFVYVFQHCLIRIRIMFEIVKFYWVWQKDESFFLIMLRPLMFELQILINLSCSFQKNIQIFDGTQKSRILIGIFRTNKICMFMSWQRKSGFEKVILMENSSW